MLENRKSGILLHISSLPSKHGIGDLGEQAYNFIDKLEQMGQVYWQILPTNEPNDSNSPYDTSIIRAITIVWLICWQNLPIHLTHLL